MEKLRKLINEEPVKPLDLAVNSIEEVLRNKVTRKKPMNANFPYSLVFETILILFFVKIVYKKLRNVLNKFVD